ncbi:hypothetical protein [Streptomyces sp. CB02923]|nr:hypothetical protein [Streptomyces sp. CB02923]
MTPHIARHRRLMLGLFITAATLTAALLGALILYVLAEVGPP